MSDQTEQQSEVVTIKASGPQCLMWAREARRLNHYGPTFRLAKRALDDFDRLTDDELDEVCDLMEWAEREYPGAGGSS